MTAGPPLTITIRAADLPAARAGVHAGPVIERDGDYFGRTVNLAARLSALPQPAQVVVSPDVAVLTADDLRCRPAGPRQVKGIGEVQVFEATWR